MKAVWTMRMGNTTHSEVMSMRTLTFSPLCTSHQGAYICQAANEKAAKDAAYVTVINPC